MERFCKHCCLGFKQVLIYLVTILLLASCASTPTEPSEQQQLVEEIGEYIVSNGEQSDDKDIYYYGEFDMKSSDSENMGEYYRLDYDASKKVLTFGCMTVLDDGTMMVTMDYEPDSTIQTISFGFFRDGSENVFTATAEIDISKYTGTNKGFVEFEASPAEDVFQEMSEATAYEMLCNCQLLLIDAGAGLVPLGFEKGLFN